MPRFARATAIALFALLVPSAADAATARPTASFTFTPGKPTVGASLVLDASRSKCAAKPCKYAWTASLSGARAKKLGTRAKVTFKLTQPGSLKLTLKVTDKRRRSATKSRVITVAALAPAFSPALPAPVLASPPPPDSGPAPSPAPSVPVIGRPAAGALLNVFTLTVSGTADPGVIVEIFEGSASHGTAVADAGGAWSGQVTVAGDGEHAFTAVARNPSGVSFASAPRVVRVDSTAPAAPAITSPAQDGLVNTSALELRGTAEPGARVEVFDGAAASGIVTAAANGGWQITLAGVADGKHAFSARATDAAGNVSPASGVRTVRFDTRAPVVTIDSGPAPVGSDTTPTFGFSADEAGVTFRCRLDGPGAAVGTEVACAPPLDLAALADGSYTLRVRGTDAAGNGSIAAASRAFAVDTAGPAAPAIMGPAELVNRSEFTVSGSAEPGARIELLEGDAPRGTATADASGAWSLPLTAVADGSHVYVARARDAAGNVSPASAERAIRVDTQAPAVPVVVAPVPDALLNGTSIDIAGTAEAGSIVALREGGASRGSVIADEQGEWTIRVADLADGVHAITATAADAAGNVSPSSPARSFRVDTRAPETKLVSGPSGEIGEPTATFSFSADEEGAVFECRLQRVGGDPAAFEPCASPRTVTGLVGGEYTFAVRALDLAGNRDPEPASAAFAVVLEEPGGSVYVSSNGDDSADCTRSAPCANFARAYEAAPDGAVLEVAAGSYLDQVLPRGEKAVSVRKAIGARPQVRTLDASTDGVSVTGLTVEKLNVRGSQQVYDDVEIDGKFARHVGLEHWQGDDNVFKNGRIGNITNEKGALIGPKRFTFDNVTFHDVRNTDPLVHNECVYATGAEGLTIRNSTFHACATMDLFVTNYAGGPDFGNVTLENNVFEHSTMESPDSWHYYSLGVHSVIGALRNWTVRNNTFEIGVGAIGIPAVAAGLATSAPGIACRASPTASMSARPAANSTTASIPPPRPRTSPPRSAGSRPRTSTPPRTHLTGDRRR